MGDCRPVGAGFFDFDNAFSADVPFQPGNGSVHSRGGDGDGLAVFPRSGAGADDGVSVSSCAGLNSDNVVVFSSTMAMTVSLPFPSGGRLVGAGPGGGIGRKLSNQSHVPKSVRTTFYQAISSGRMAPPSCHNHQDGRVVEKSFRY